MHIEVRCSSCGGSGQSYVGTPNDPYAFFYCLNCHGRGTVTKNVSNSSAGCSAAAIEVDTRTDEEKKVDGENSIAGFLSFCLGSWVVVSALMQGGVAWWIPTIMGIVIWIAMTKILQGPLRIIPILIRKLLIIIATLLAWTIASLLVVGLFYVVFKIVQGAN